MKKFLSLLLIGIMVFSIIPLYPVATIEAADYSESEFFVYLDSIGKRKYTYSNTYKANVDTYNEYNLIVYGNPHGDTKPMNDWNTSPPSSCSGVSGFQYRNLGYDLEGDSYTNPCFPPDVTGSQPPENWNFIPVPGEPDNSWPALEDVQASHMLTSQLYGNGATTLTVQSIGGRSYAKIQSGSTLRTQGSAYTLNTSGGQTYYATFTVPALAGNTLINGSIDTPKNTYIITADQQDVEVPVTAVANANINGAFTKSQIKNFTVSLLGETSSSQGNVAQVTHTKNITYSRTDYPVGSHTIILEGQASLESVFPEDGVITEELSKKQMKLVVEAQGPDPVITADLNADPSTQVFEDQDIEVEVTASGDLTNFKAEDAHKIERWDFYIRKANEGTTTKKEINSQNISESLSVDYTIPASAMNDQDAITQEFVTTVRIFFTEEISGSTKADSLYYIEDQSHASTKIYREATAEDPMPTPPPEPPPSTNEPPVAKITTKSTVKAGDEFSVNGNNSYDPDGSIVLYDWNEDANGSLSGANGGTLWYNSPGTETIGLCVVDNEGDADCDAESITVTEPLPTARIKTGGTLKENRKVELDFSTSSSPAHFPMDWSKTIYSISPVSNGLTQSDIQIHSSSTDQQVVAQFKKSGTYTVSLMVENSAGYTDTEEKRFIIEKDQKPVAQYAASSKLFRDASHDYKARIEIFNQSYSPDADLIDKTVWKIIHDSDNDGLYTDNNTLTIDDSTFTDGQTKTYTFNGNSIKVQIFKVDKKMFITVPKIGDYRIEAIVTEAFYQPYISSYVTATDFRSSSSFDTKDESLSIVQVDNLAPIVDFQMTEKQQVNLQFSIGDTQHDDRDLLESKIQSIVVPQLEAQNIEVDVAVEQTMSYTDQWVHLDGGTWFMNLEHGLISGGTSGATRNGHDTVGRMGYVNNQTLLQNIQQISSYEHTLALLPNGQVAVWGDSEDNYGRGTLGLGRSIPSTYEPALVQGGETGNTHLENVVKVGTVSMGGSFALLSNGRVVAWGNNYYVGARAEYPTYVPGGETGDTYLENVVDMTVHNQQVFFILSDGKVITLGRNTSGGAGVGHTSILYTPAYVIGGETGTPHLQSVEKVIMSEDENSAYALLTDGRVVGWGNGYQGQLGNNNTAQQTSPVYVKGGQTGTTYLENVDDIYEGFYKLFALLGNGKAVSMGYNAYGALGNNNTTNQKTPVYIRGGEIGTTHLQDIEKLVVGKYIGFALLKSGQVMSWGDHAYGKLGTGEEAEDALAPKYVKGGETGTARIEHVTDIQTNGRATFATQPNAILVWGKDSNLIGDTTYDGTNVPMYMQSSYYVRFPIHNIGEMYSGGWKLGYLDIDDPSKFYAWGRSSYNSYQMNPRLADDLERLLKTNNEHIVDMSLGTGSQFLTNSGRIISNGLDYTTSGRGISRDDNTSNMSAHGYIDTVYSDFVKVVAAGSASYGLRSNGTVMAWGRDHAGQQGDGYHHDNDFNESPRQVKYLSDVVDILSSPYALTSSGNVYTWGNENNTRELVTTDVQKIVKNGSYAAALKSDGSVYSLHYDYTSRIRNENTFENITAVDIDEHFIYLADGKILTYTYRYASDPIVGGETGESYLTKGMIQSSSSDGPGRSYIALLQDGRAVSWGRNSNGQLGNGSSDDQTTPVFVKGGITGTPHLQNIQSVYMADGRAFAIHAEEGLLYWGPDGDEELHTRDQTMHTTPVNFIKSGPIPYRLFDMPTANEAFASTSWSENKDNFYIYVQDSEAKDLTNSGGRSSLASKLINHQVSLIGLGTPTNRSQIEAVIQQNEDQGQYMANGNIDAALDDIVSYILADVEPEYPIVTEKIALKEDENGQYTSKELEYMSFYEDPEQDPVYAEQYFVIHDPTVYENHQGYLEGSVFSSPPQIFNKVGKYELTYKAQDNPTGSLSMNHAFKDYRKWSEASKSKRVIYIHRAPKAVFTASTSCGSSSCSVAIQNQSYDLDHYSSAGRGIVQLEWQYKKSTAASWTNGKVSSISKGDVYTQKLRVKDIDGAWSDPFTTVIDTSGAVSNQPPIAQFVIKPNSVSVTGSTTIKDDSFDPDGDTITQRDWTVIKNEGTTVYSGSSQPANIASYGVGSYKITLKVYDGSEWSSLYSQHIEVVNFATEPDFTLASDSFRDTLLQPVNLTANPDRDGHSVTYQWRAKLDGSTYNIGTSTAPNFRIRNFGLTGDAVSNGWIIELTATDSTGKSSVLSRPLNVVNRIPTASISGPVAAQQYGSQSYASGSSDPDSEDTLNHAWKLIKPSGSVVYWTSTNISIAFDQAGEHTLELKVTDSVGDYDSTHMTINVAPNTPPQTTLANYKGSSNSPTYTNDSTPTLQVNVTDAESHSISYVDYEVFSVNQGEWVVNTQATVMSYTPAVLSDGKYYWRARSFDGYDTGAYSSDGYFFIDTQKPVDVNEHLEMTSDSVTVMFNSFSDPMPSSGHDRRRFYMQKWLGSTYEIIDINQNGTKEYSLLIPTSSSVYTVNGLDSESQYRLTVIDWDRAGNQGHYAYIYFKPNRPPTADLTWSPQPVWEGEQVNLLPMVNDPDMDSLQLTYTITDPSGDVTEYEQTQDAMYDNQGPTFTASEPGSYTVNLLVSDGMADEVDVNKVIDVGPLSVIGRVLHTEEWDDYREKYNEQYPEESRADLDFWAGEIFRLEAETTNLNGSILQVDHVEVEWVETSQRTGLQSEAGTEAWHGEFWQESLDQLEDGSYIFIFHATWSHGVEKSHQVAVKIIDSIWNTVGVHRRF